MKAPREPKPLRVVETRSEQRGARKYRVVVLAPGAARGSGATKSAWHKLRTAKPGKMTSRMPDASPGFVRGDRMFHRGLIDDGDGRPNDERLVWLRPEEQKTGEEAA